MEFLNKVTRKLKTKPTLETDAVPSYPDIEEEDISGSRVPPTNSNNVEDVSDNEYSYHGGDSSPIITDPTDDTPPVPPRRKKSKAKPQPQNDEKIDSDPEDKEGPQSPRVNTQATGNVINIVNSKGVHVGTSLTCHFGSPDDKKSPFKFDEDSEAKVPKTKTIVAIMNCKDKVTHEYMDVLSRHLGSGWKKVFRKLGYTDPMLETFHESHKHKGLPEVIYQVILDWTRTGKRTLGELCTVTWKQGKRIAVSEVAKIFKENMKNGSEYEK